MSMPRVAASFPHASVVVTPGTTTLQLMFLPAQRSANRRIVYSITHLPNPGVRVRIRVRDRVRARGECTPFFLLFRSDTAARRGSRAVLRGPRAQAAVAVPSGSARVTKC